MRFVVVAGLMALLGLTARVRAQTPGPDVRVGCYAFTLVAPASWDGQRSDSIYYRPPPFVRFARSSDGESGPHPIRVPEGSIPSPHRSGTWRVVGDTVRASWSTGFIGLGARLVAVEGGVLEGEAWPFTDVVGGPAPERARIAGTPSPCADSVRYPLASVRRFARSVPLESGRELVLGEPPPDGVTLDGNELRSIVTGDRAAGLFGDAERLSVRLDRGGRVASIGLRYPSGHDLERLLDGLIARWGRWTGSGAYDGNREWVWSGRVETMFLTRHSTGRLSLSISPSRRSW